MNTIPNFDNKTFRVVRNDGPDAEVTTETVFHFHQHESDGVVIIHADYFGGRVRYGKLVGVLKGDTMRHSYVQMNLNGEFHSGESTDEVRFTPEGKIQLIDSWQWTTREGKGLCIMEEV
jgi:hypothetical protein